MPGLTENDLLIHTTEGLYCPAGAFHIDPWRPVERAVVTHAHSDHACPGSRTYLASRTGAIVLRARVGAEASITGVEFGQPLTMDGVRVTLFPAGHILGSAQVRIERGGEVWVVSGDYKTAGARDGEARPDRTSEAFEPVRCDVFITESTFGLPIYRWRSQDEVFSDINAWWRQNQLDGRTSVIYAYSLGKAQRVLAGVDSTIGPLGVHGAVERMNRAYADAGIALPEALHADAATAQRLQGQGLIVAPPSAAGVGATGNAWLRKFAGDDGISAGLVSGWMQVRGTRRRGGSGVDRGFVLSDHADWDGLLWAIGETGATRVGVTHGFIAPLVRWLRESGRADAFEVPTRFSGETDDEAPGEAA